MKILFSGYRNPSFRTITEYAEKAFLDSGCEVDFFNDRKFVIPGRLREAFPLLDRFELMNINRRLIDNAAALRPKIMFACGGIRILPAALEALGRMGITRILWTVDSPRQVESSADNFMSLFKSAPLYDHVFCGGSEALEYFRAAGINNAVWLPFACDPGTHFRREPGPEEKGRLGCDICFVGTMDQRLYPKRFQTLEALSDMDLKVWGPGAETVPASSPLKKRVAGGRTPPELWAKIYGAAKITLCMHYSSPGGDYKCHQASPRVYEALACGAFLLCDAQKDVLSLFEDGKHLVVFRDAEDLRKKIAYYLAHPEKRAAIALAGREEVLKKHTYRDRIRVVLGAVNGK